MHGITEHEKSAPKADAKVHDGIWLELRMKSDESIIGTANGVIRAKTGRRLPEDQRWRAEEVLTFEEYHPALDTCAG